MLFNLNGDLNIPLRWPLPILESLIR